MGSFPQRSVTLPVSLSTAAICYKVCFVQMDANVCITLKAGCCALTSFGSWCLLCWGYFGTNGSNWGQRWMNCLSRWMLKCSEKNLWSTVRIQDNQYYYSFKIFSHFWLVKTTCIIHHNQLLFTKFGKNLRHIESMTSKVQPTENHWTDDVK